MIAAFFNLAAPDLVIILILFGIPIIIMQPIMRKAGYNPTWALLAFIPLGLAALLIFLAVAQWPVLKVKGVDNSDRDLPPPRTPGV